MLEVAPKLDLQPFECRRGLRPVFGFSNREYRGELVVVEVDRDPFATAPSRACMLPDPLGSRPGRKRALLGQNVDELAGLELAQAGPSAEGEEDRWHCSETVGPRCLFA